MGLHRDLHRFFHFGFEASDVGAEQAEGFTNAGIEIGGHAARHGFRVGIPGSRGVTNAEGPDAPDIKIRRRHDPFVPDKGDEPPVGHMHGELFQMGEKEDEQRDR